MFTINDNKTNNKYDTYNTNNSNIINIIKIKDPTKFFKNNLNSIYILQSFGKRNYDEDEIDLKIKNLKFLKFNFNVNETFIFRTFENNKILIYEFLENRLHIIITKLNIINAYLIFDNYILIKYDNFKDYEILNYQNFKSLKVLSLEKDKLLLHGHMFDLVYKNILENEKLFKNHVIIKKENYLILYSSVVKNDVDENEINKIDINNTILCEKIWGSFTLVKEPCFVYSIIKNKKRYFKYYVNINNKIFYFDNIFDMITFLQKNFYLIIKECILLVRQ